MDLEILALLDYVMLGFSADLGLFFQHLQMVLLEIFAQEEDSALRAQLFKPIALWVHMEIQLETELKLTVYYVTQGKD